MIVSGEVLLVFGVLGFYLYDSACLLYRNEVIFSECRRQWRGTTGSSLLLRGRFLFLPNPMTPYVVTFRSSWRLDGRRQEAEQPFGVTTFLRALWPLRAGSVVVGMLLVVVLPVMLFLDASPLAFLALLAAVYVNVLGMMMWIYKHRMLMKLSGQQVLALALDGLACPPNAINLARKVAMHRGIEGDAFSIADVVLREGHRARFRRELEERIGMTADFAEQGSAEMMGLEASRRRLEELMP